MQYYQFERVSNDIHNTILFISEIVCVRVVADPNHHQSNCLGAAMLATRTIFICLVAISGHVYQHYSQIH